MVYYIKQYFFIITMYKMFILDSSITVKIIVYTLLFIFIMTLINKWLNYIKQPNPPQSQNTSSIESFENPPELQPASQPSYTKFINSSTPLFNASNSYLSSMNSSNLRARHITLESQLQQYSSSLLEITDADKSAVNEFIGLIVEMLEMKGTNHATRCKNFMLHMLRKIRIAKGNAWLESGMPHTHQDIIVFPAYWFNEIANTSTRTNQIKISENGGTLVHEIIHVLQRIYPAKFANLYKQWNFTNARYIDNFNEIQKLSRANPDGLDINWIWRTPAQSTISKYYWLGAIFKSPVPSSLTEVDYVAISVYDIGRGNFKMTEEAPIPLGELAELRNFYGITNNHYHPNEIVAEYFSIWFNNTIGTVPNPTQGDKPAYRIFESWLDSDIL
jgi:hypothetical protein